MNFLFLFENLGRKYLIIYSILRYIFVKFFRGILYEKEANGFKILNRKKNLKIIDIGTNDGLSTSFFLKIFKNSIIYIFEPLKFKNNYLKNKNNNKVKVYNIALGETNKKSYLNIPYYNFFLFEIYLSAYSTISNSKNKIYNINKSLKTFFFYNKINKKRMKVEIKKLDNFNLKVDIIKLDVEGYEDNVIKGSIKTIKKYKPLLYIERPTKKTTQFLKKLDYEIFVFDLDNKSFIKATENLKKYRNYFFINRKKNLIYENKKNQFMGQK